MSRDFLRVFVVVVSVCQGRELLRKVPLGDTSWWSDERGNQAAKNFFGFVKTSILTPVIMHVDMGGL